MHIKCVYVIFLIDTLSIDHFHRSTDIRLKFVDDVIEFLRSGVAAGWSVAGSSIYKKIFSTDEELWLTLNNRLIEFGEFYKEVGPVIIKALLTSHYITG